MSDTEPTVEVEVRHYLSFLRQAIRAAGLTVTAVERQLGSGPKSLRRIFTGEVDLKLKHLIAVLRVVGLSQEEFFAAASRGRRPPEPPAPKPALLLSDLQQSEQFDRLVEEAVNRALQRRLGHYDRAQELAQNQKK